jgi:hypothetical protein
MAGEERGSTKWAKAHSIAVEDLEELGRLVSSEGELLYWLTHGTPAIDRVAGAVQLSGKENAGRVIDRMYSLESLRLRLIVHPIGVPVTDGLLVNFRQE